MTENDSSHWSRRGFLRSGVIGIAATSGCLSGGNPLSNSTPTPKPTPASHPTGDENWPQFRYDSRNSGYHPTANAPRKKVELCWKLTVERSFALLSSPVAINGIVYVGFPRWYDYSDDRLVAANAKTGQVIWLYDGTILKSSFVRNEDTVFAGNGAFYALDRYTGEKRWKVTGEDNGVYVSNSPTLAEGRIYVSSDYSILAIDPRTGERLWDYRTGSWVHSTPAVNDGKAFVASEDGKLYALDAESGELLWTFAITPPDGYPETPVIGDETVYYGSDEDDLYALDTEKGTIQWKYEYTEGFGFGTPAVSQDSIVTRGGADDGHLVALDPKTGDRLWNYTEGGHVYDHIVCSTDTVVAKKGSDLTAHDAKTGKKLWSVTVGMPGSDPAIADGVVYVGGTNGVYAFTDRQ